MGTPEPTTPTLRALVAAGVLTPETSVAIEREAWRQSLKQVRAALDFLPPTLVRDYLAPNPKWDDVVDRDTIRAILDSLSPKEK